MDNTAFPTPTEQIAATVIDKQAVIVLADSGQVTVLNELGTFIWQRCDGAHPIGQILQDIIAGYEVDSSSAERDLTQFLEQMVGIGAIQIQEAPEKKQAGS